MTTVPTPALRRAMLVTGVLFLATFVTSIAALALFQPLLDDPAGYIAGPGADGRVLLGVALELLLIAANVGTALALLPVLRRQHEQLAVGYVAARIVECVFIAFGIVCVLGVVSLGHDDPSAGTLAVSLAALKDWTFLLGPGIVVGLGNGLILGYLMLRSGLVPRRMAMLGLVGGPLVLVSGLAVLLGLIEAGGVAQGIATVPEFLWELALGIYLTVLGCAGATAPGLRRLKPTTGAS